MLIRYLRYGSCAILISLDACRPGAEKPQASDSTRAKAIPVDIRMAEPRSTEDSLRQGVIAVSAASVTPLERQAGRTRALLEVRFRPDRRGGKPISIRPEDREVTLRDDGTQGDGTAEDGVFSATIDLSDAELNVDAARTRAARAQPRFAPQFIGRVRAQRGRIPPEALQDLRTAPVRIRIPLDIFALIDPNLASRSLMINDPAVVNDPARTFDVCNGTGTQMGKWTFGHLMTEMANQSVTSISASDFTRAWLAQWEANQTVNTFSIPARTQILQRIINPWLQASGGTGQLNLAIAPFRLLAIVNRVDLRQNLLYGGGSAGEGRFVFEVVDRSSGGCSPMQFTVIFEYGVQKNSCQAVRAWGKQWFDLRTMAPSDPAYRAALEAITEQFVKAGSNPAQTPNQNSLSQLRTNERAIGIPWELREFALAGTGHLASTTTKQEPDMSFHDSDALVAWINANGAAVAAGKHSVPLSIASGPFLAARSFIPNDNTSFFWDRGADITQSNARFQFSVSTCSGCHSGETKTVFTHVKPGTGFPAALSGFLTGISVTDPDATDADTTVRVFNDLERRAADLDGLVNSACIRQFGFNNISRMSH